MACVIIRVYCLIDNLLLLYYINKKNEFYDKNFIKNFNDIQIMTIKVFCLNLK